MKFGRTHEEKRLEQIRLSDIYGTFDDKYEPWYAWRPVRLHDGRIAWLEQVNIRWHTWQSNETRPWSKPRIYAYYEKGLTP